MTRAVALGRYDALMDVVRSRMTNRAFAPYDAITSR